MILGYILTLVYITLQGDVRGETLNYYYSLEKCYENALALELKSQPGVGYVCIEDTEATGERL